MIQSVFEDMEKDDIEDNGDEPDTPLMSSNRKGHHTAQPNIGDLQWIQIEDFVEIFNRIYVVYSLINHKIIQNFRVNLGCFGFSNSHFLAV